MKVLKCTVLNNNFKYFAHRLWPQSMLFFWFEKNVFISFSSSRFSTKESAAHAIVAIHNSDVNGHTVKCSWGKESGDPNNLPANSQVCKPWSNPFWKVWFKCIFSTLRMSVVNLYISALHIWYIFVFDITPYISFVKKYIAEMDDAYCNGWLLWAD